VSGREPTEIPVVIPLQVIAMARLTFEQAKEGQRHAYEARILSAHAPSFY
jgi:hypothetical protein